MFLIYLRGDIISKSFIKTILIVLISKTEVSLQLTGEVCKNEDTGKAECCYNNENNNGVCTQCTIGTVAPSGGRCLPCEQNKYGYKCLNYCMCNQSQRCDVQMGCILNTETTIEARYNEYSLSTKNVITIHLFPDSTSKGNAALAGPSSMEWIIYSLCVIGFLIVIAISHVLRSYRKRSSINVPRVNGGEDIAMRQEQGEHPYIEIYDEIDENLLEDDDKKSRQLKNTNATITEVRTNKISGEDDTSSYLDPYFAVDENETQGSLKESSSPQSSNFDLVLTECIKLYPPIDERKHQLSDGYKVGVHVGQCFDSSSGSASSEEESFSYRYSHVYQNLHTDQSTNIHVYEKSQKTLNEIDSNISEKNEKQSCRNNTSIDSKGNSSISLLYKEKSDGIDNERGEHLFVGQTKGDAFRGISHNSLYKNCKCLKYTDNLMDKDQKQTFCSGDCQEEVPCVDFLVII